MGIINTGEPPGARSKRKLAEMLYAQGTGGEPVQHWMQGVAKLAQAGIGGYQMYQLDQEERARDRDARDLLMQAPGLQQPSGANAARPESPSPAVQPTPANVPVAAATPATATARAEVTPSGKVWGDKEAENAGLYEPRVASAAPPTQATRPPGIAQDQATYIRRLMSNPQTRDYGAALYQKAMTEASQATKPTDEIREYEYSQRNPGFKDYKTDLKKAGAIQNQVMIDQKGEGEFSKESGKIQAKRFGELAEDGPTSKQMISDIETLRTLGAQIGTGRGAAVMAALGPYAKAIGVDVNGLDEVQAYEAIIARVAPALRVKGSGAQSDYELKTFLKSLPSLGNTPGGNEISSQVLQGLYENKVRAAEIGARALNGQISRPDAEKMLREMPDPMAGYREFIKRTKPAAAKAQQDIRSKYGLE